MLYNSVMRRQIEFEMHAYDCFRIYSACVLMNAACDINLVNTYVLHDAI